MNPPTVFMSRISLRRVWGLMYRHLAVYRRSWPRLLELAYWPTLQLLIWGFTARFFAARLGANIPTSGEGAALAALGALLGGVLLWEVALRSQMGVAVSFLEELWSRNLGHVFVSPLRPGELLAALLGMSLLRMLTGLAPAVLLAWLLYAFNLFSLGPALILFAANLIMMGWWVALFVVSLILRHGLGAEALAWSVLFALTPFSCVYYPVTTLPASLRPIAYALPSSHVFEGMRAVIDGGSILWGQLGIAVLLNALWMALAVVVFMRQFRAARMSGALLSIGE